MPQAVRAIIARSFLRRRKTFTARITQKPPGLWWNPPRALHIRVPFQIFCLLKKTCARGMPLRNYCRLYWSNDMDRRSFARQHLNENEVLFTLTCFPRLGVQGQFTEPFYDPTTATSSHSLFLPDEIMNPHPRFPLVISSLLEPVPTYIFHCSTLTVNMRHRRGSKVAINLPIFIDSKTPRPFIDPTIPWERSLYPEDPGGKISTSPPTSMTSNLLWNSEAKNGAALADHIYMDAPAFGNGCCCLQVTFQACNVSEARRMYDGLIPVTPILVSYN